MKLDSFLSKYGKKMGYLEMAFFKNIYYEDLGDAGLEFITPEVDIDRNDGTGRKWRIDFVIKTKFAKYAIECDGFNYHASGMVSKDRDNDLHNKRNETIRQGYIYTEITRDQIVQNPSDAIYQLRRLFIADEELFSIFLNRNKGLVSPHEVQEIALNKLNETRSAGKKKGLVVLATGLGKTYLGVFDTRQLKSKKILFIVHVGEVLKDARNSFEEVMPERSKEMGFFTGKEKESGKNIIFATIQTLNREKNLNQFDSEQFDYIILDETHHGAAPSYKPVFEYFNPKFFLGLTATPDRMDNKEILPFYNNNLVFKMDQDEAIKKGYLTGLKYLGFKDNVDYSQIYFNGFKYDISDLNKALMIEKRDRAIIEKFKEMGANKKTIGFCVSIEHADWCAKKFREVGINAISIHSKLDRSEQPIEMRDRDKLIKGFKEGKYQVAFVVDMFNEGVNFPDVECVLLLRPTESATILTQQIGRGLRISPGKKEVLILDFIGNYKTAHNILPALGIGGTGELTKDNERDIYYYDNNGRRVEFENEVVEIFKMMLSKSTKKVRSEVLSKEWMEYADYLEKWTKDNLYWKTTQQNRHFPVQLEGLNIIKNNPSISEEDFKNEVGKIVEKNYPNKTMTAGFRALMLSKISGLVSLRSPLKVTPAFLKIKKICKGNFSNIEEYQEILTSQIEKIFYWNIIYGTFSKYVPSDERVSYKDFHLYPFFFLYEVLLKLIDDYGYKDGELSKLEFNSFLAISKNQEEVNETLEKIINFRNYEEKYELEKLLNKKNNIDPRFFNILAYNKYLIMTRDGVKLNQKHIPELRKRVSKFLSLMNSKKLIMFNEELPEKYLKMLYSEKDILSYHGN